MTRSSCKAVTVLVSTFFLFSAVTSLSQSVEAPPIGAGRVLFGDSQVTENRFVVRAFVPTGSLSDNCLATLSDSMGETGSPAATASMGADAPASPAPGPEIQSGL